MKQDLKRIEAALHRIADRQSVEQSPPVLQPTPLPEGVLAAVPSDTASPDSRTDVTLPSFAKTSPVRSPEPANPISLEVPVPPLSANLSEIKIPSLPRIKSPNFTSHRNAANPTLAMGLLKEIETTVVGWQEELQQVVRQIQDLYMEGPIVDGWMESYAHQHGESPVFRHADVNCLMDYIEKMRNAPLPEPSTPSPPAYGTKASQPTTSTAGYRLCGLNEDGQLWFRHCPAEQVPAVSLAIARYQRLRLLLTRKQFLETRLEKLAETLVTVHGQMQA